jgi:hypothetical protein
LATAAPSLVAEEFYKLNDQQQQQHQQQSVVVWQPFCFRIPVVLLDCMEDIEKERLAPAIEKITALQQVMIKHTRARTTHACALALTRIPTLTYASASSTAAITTPTHDTLTTDEAARREVRRG